MDTFIQTLKTNGFSGDIDTSMETRDKFSHDASLFELVPQVVVAPKNDQDVQLLVRTVAAHKSTVPDLSLTARSAGTCMSGGAISESVVVDFKKYFSAADIAGNLQKMPTVVDSKQD